MLDTDGRPSLSGIIISTLSACTHHHKPADKTFKNKLSIASINSRMITSSEGNEALMFILWNLPHLIYPKDQLLPQFYKSTFF